MAGSDSPLKTLERAPTGSTHSLPALLDALRFNADGLIPAIAQDADSRTVLMMAWMNREALEQTLRSGRATYWSRSRAALWCKGETSGHVQRVRRVHFDCDGDTVLLEIDQTGPACHTGRPHCFYLSVDLADDPAGDDLPGQVRISAAALVDPDVVYGRR